jgi:alpha-amylase
MLIDRGTLGTVIVNAGGSTYLNSATNLANGTYTNHGSASCTLTVSNGTIAGNIPGNSIIVLYNSTTPNPTPTPTDRVTWTPTTPVVGSTVTVTYDSSNSALKGSSSVTAHWGYDSWKGTTDTVMTKASDNLWKVTLTVPTAATSQLNLCFTNGSTWDSNNSANWSISVTKSGSSTITYPRAGYTVDYDSSTLVKGGSFNIYYKGALANSSKVLLHWGTNGWTTVTTTDVSMTKRSDGFWQGTITIPTTASQLDFVFTDGTNWDNNSSKDWHLTVN